MALCVCSGNYCPVFVFKCHSYIVPSLRGLQCRCPHITLQESTDREGVAGFQKWYLCRSVAGGTQPFVVWCLDYLDYTTPRIVLGSYAIPVDNGAGLHRHFMYDIGMQHQTIIFCVQESGTFGCCTSTKFPAHRI